MSYHGNIWANVGNHCKSLDGFMWIGVHQPGMLKDAWLGINMQNAPGPGGGTQWQTNYNNMIGPGGFVEDMWNGWINGWPNIWQTNVGRGCEFWPNRITHWGTEIVNIDAQALATVQAGGPVNWMTGGYLLNSDLYEIGREEAKIKFGQAMWMECKCGEAANMPQPKMGGGNENVVASAESAPISKRKSIPNRKLRSIPDRKLRSVPKKKPKRGPRRGPNRGTPNRY